MRPALSLILLCAVAPPALAQDAGSASPPHPLAGTWKLDVDACTDPKAVLDHFEANFIVRSFARSIVTVNVITWKGNGLELEVRAPVYNRRTVLMFDGTTPTSEEVLGAPYSYTSTLEGDVVVSRGTVRLKDGTTEPLSTRRSVRPDGRMVLEMTISPKDKPPIVVKRIFNRQKP